MSPAVRARRLADESRRAEGLFMSRNLFVQLAGSSILAFIGNMHTAFFSPTPNQHSTLKITPSAEV
jgi:hypothetical protein